MARHELRRHMLTLGLILSWSGPRCLLAEPPDSQAEFVALMNKGKAYLENREADQTVAAYRRAVELRPDSNEARINLALAHLLARQKSEPDKHLREALQQLAEVRKRNPDSVAGHYLAGLAYGHLNEFDKSAEFLLEAARRDPNTAALRYQLAQALKRLDKHDEAAEQLAKTLELDPLHASAHYQLAHYARKAARKSEAQEHIKEFTRLRKLFGEATREPTMLERCEYTEARDPLNPREPVEPGIGVKFTEVTTEWASGIDRPDMPGCAFGILDVNGDERWDIIVARPDGKTALWLGGDGPFKKTELPPGPATAWRRCIVGDYDNNGLSDAFFLGATGNRLLRRAADTEFEDVTEAASLLGAAGEDAVWVDFDHDGDLDLMIAAGGDKPVSLMLNKGNGTFEEYMKQANLPESLTGVVCLAAGDLNTDDAIDVVLGTSNGGSRLVTNAREGRFENLEDPPGPWPPAVSIDVNDADNDGHPDVLLVGSTEAVIIRGRPADRGRVDLGGLEPTRGFFLDYDNDGWLDVVVLGQNRTIAVWRNLARGGFQDVSEALGLNALSCGGASDGVAADFDNDGDSDLLISTDTGLTFLRNDGGNSNRQLRLALDGLKSNRSCLGVRAEIRSGDTRVSRSISRLPVEIGVGNSTNLDSLRLVWTNGVIQNEMDVQVAAGKSVPVKEKKVATGSCPFLYAWDGKRFRFVTDILGNSPLGLSAARGKFLPADPTEHVWIGNDENFVPRDGHYVLQVTDEFREAVYLDEARLVAVDHPPGTEVHPRDKIQLPPFAPSELWTLSPAAPLSSAVANGTAEWTEELLRIDGRFSVPAGALASQMRGITAPEVLVLDFGALATHRPLVLALTGWLQYGDASVNISASQNPDLPVIFPRLEVEVGTDVWRPVDVVVGMPAGKTKTILADLTGKLPVGSRRLRLTTTFELRWDRMALLEKSPSPASIERTWIPERADLHHRGFSEISSRAPGHPTTPDYDNVSPVPPWAGLPTGWCTRYGEVMSLLRRMDDRLAILNGGDELTLQFDASQLPPLPNCSQRTFFFYSVGWDKDSDHNVSLGDTVDPLPFHGMDDNRYGDEFYPLENEEENWQVEFNTRFVPRETFAGATR